MEIIEVEIYLFYLQSITHKRKLTTKGYQKQLVLLIIYLLYTEIGWKEKQPLRGVCCVK